MTSANQVGGCPIHRDGRFGHGLSGALVDRVVPDTRRMFDKVHMALPHALDDAGNDSPLPDADAQSPDKLGDGGSDLAQIRRAEAEISWNWTWVEACRQSIPPEHQRWKA